MDDKTKKKRVTAEKRSVRKQREKSEPAAVEAIAPAKIETKKVEAAKVETKKVRKSVKPKSVKKKSVIAEPTFEQVQLRAYFIAERRTQLGIAGNEHQDWVAAERELREEMSS